MSKTFFASGRSPRPVFLPARAAGPDPVSKVASAGQTSRRRTGGALPWAGSGAGADAEHGVRERAFRGALDRQELRDGLVHPAAQPLGEGVLRAPQDLAEFVQGAVQVSCGRA